MKAALRLSLAACLILILSSGVLAAPASSFYHGDTVTTSMASIFEMPWDSFAPSDRLFSTEEEGPQLKVRGLIGYDGPDLTLVNAAYTLNDFIYGTLYYMDDGFNLQGGYLWEDLGIYASLDYTDTPGPSGYLVTGGYRFDLGDGSYAALSLYYGGGDYDGALGGQATVKYYADGLKLSGQLYVNDEGDYLIHGKANVAAGDNLVWGGGLTWNESGYQVFAGLTRTGEKSLLDAVVDVDDGGSVVYYLSYLYSISDALAVGLGYMDGDIAGQVTLKGQYELGDGSLNFSYTCSADGGPGAFIGLGYEKSL